MNKIIVLIVVLLSLVSQASANIAEAHEGGAVVSAMLAEPYIAALLSLVLLIASLI